MQRVLVGALFGLCLFVAPVASAADSGPAPGAPPVGQPLEEIGYLPMLPQPWESQYRAGMRTAARGAVTAGVGLALAGAGLATIRLADPSRDGGVLVGTLLTVGGVIGVFTGAPMMGFGAERGHRALRRAGVRVTGVPGDVSGVVWLGVMVVTLVNVWTEGTSDELLIADYALILAACGLAAAQMQINSNGYWGRDRVVAQGRSRLRVVPTGFGFAASW